MNRTCKSCRVIQPVAKFPIAGVIKGIQYYRHLCQNCYQGQKDKRRKQLKSEIRKYKNVLRCRDCGLQDSRVIEFHHEDDATKEDSVANMVKNGKSITNIMKEIDKCIPLCANCHRIRHYRE